MRIIITLLLLITTIPTLAQDDPEAKSIIDKVSTKNNSFKTIRSDFKYTWASMRDNQTQSETGKIALRGDLYHLIMAGSDITFDGKSTYTYLKESNEINITKPEPSKAGNGDFFFSNPRDLFKIKNDFKILLW